MKELFDQLKSITDIFNVGRLVFYPFAGALVVVPFYFLVRIFVQPPAALLHLQLASDIDSMGGSWRPLVFFLASTVVGFLVAVAGFSILDRVGAEASKEVAAQNPNYAVSFTYNYPLLRQKKDEDYATWLIGEYFRYVEIATYIPLAAIVGLGLMTLYVLVFVVRQFPDDASSHVILTLLLSIWIIVKWYLWPHIWLQRVIVPTLRSFLRAKANLIEGVKTVERQVGPYKPQDSPAPAGAPAAGR